LDGRIRLKTNKTFTRGSRKKSKIKRIKTKLGSKYMTMMKLKTNKIFTKGSRTKIKRIRIEVEKSTTKKTKL
jgi:hypothetical protein